MNLARQHFLQSVEAIKIGKNLKLPEQKVITLAKKNPKFKTIYLDLDETLIHCDEATNNYTVKLNFPIEGGAVISVNFYLILGWDKSEAILPGIFRRALIVRRNNYLYCFLAFICWCGSGLFGSKEKVFLPSSLSPTLHFIKRFLYQRSKNCK